MKAAIYARISDDRDGTRLGVGRQLADCRTLAEQKGWEIAGEYVDNDLSAYKRLVRPEYRRMLDDIAAGVAEGLVVYHLDRLHRQPRELEAFFDVCDRAGVSDLASVTGDVDLSTGDGRFMARIQGAVARKESDDKSRRIRRKALELAQNGKIGGGGTRPFGFESDRKTIRPSEAAIIVEAAGRVLAGEAVRSICFDFNARDIKTVTGRDWVPQVLTRMLKSGRISGRREHRGEIVADAEWPAIIPAEDGNRLRAMLSDPARRKNGQARRYLLAGMLRCERCGEPLISRPRDDGRRRYVCGRRPGSKACGKLAVVADELEELVVEMVSFRLEGPDLARALASRNGSDEDVHQREVDEAAGQLEELAAAYGDRKITMVEWLAARGPIEARLERAKAALARSSGAGAVVEFIGNTSALRDSWDGLPLERRRAILFAVIDYVTIGPARRGFNRFDPGRVKPVWNV
jgi:site-specific DNA recombinase